MSTFVLRLIGAGGGNPRGTVRHVASGTTRPFADAAQLLAFLDQWTATEGPWVAARDESPLFRDPENPVFIDPVANPGTAAPGNP